MAAAAPAMAGQVAMRETDKVFVYGSLRRGGALHGQLRRSGVRWLGVGRIRGRWSRGWRNRYDLGDYPGGVLSRSPLDWVEGELYQLSNPKEQLRQLDELEEYDAQQPERSLFARRLVEVRLLTGQKHHAWAYFLPKNPRK